jgi:hypothetical protein
MCNFVEVSRHNLEYSQTLGFRIQCLHDKQVSNHFCSGVGGGGGGKVSVKSKEEKNKNFSNHYDQEFGLGTWNCVRFGKEIPRKKTQLDLSSS